MAQTQTLMLKMRFASIQCRLQQNATAAPGPCWRNYSAPPDPLVGLMGSLRGGDEEGGKGNGGERKGREKRGREGREESGSWKLGRRLTKASPSDNDELPNDKVPM